MKEYPNGDPEVLAMIANGQFDPLRAKAILEGTDPDMPISIPSGSTSYSTTYLYEAVAENDLAAVSFFLDNGADPNLNDPDLTGSCALWELQYIDRHQDWRIRYEIAKLFFRHGADPDLICDGETFYDYVLYKVYNDDPNDENDWENLRHLYKLLVLYGGGKARGRNRPVLKEEIDLRKIDEYDVRLHRCEDGYRIYGTLVDGEGNEIGLL